MKELANTVTVALIAVATLSVGLISCEDNSKSGMILTDANTGKQYLMVHNVGKTYFIKERKTIVSGKDTTYVFQ